VSGGNIDALVLAQLLADIRPRAPRKPRRRASERTRPPLPTVLAPSLHSLPLPVSAIPSDLAVEETSW
jgi:threonine dehydratase